MSTVVKTSEEFSSRRKVRYGLTDTPAMPSIYKDSKVLYSLTPNTINASITPHKSYYGKDSDGNNAYFIEFNIGDFRFDEISIRTEGKLKII